MDNVIRYAKKYYFWPVCLLALGLALFFWSSSTGGLDKEFTTNESNYTQSKSSVDNIPTNPPNEKAIKAVERKKNALMHNVYNAWELLYNKQNERNEWPEIIINDRQVDFTADRISGDGAEQYRYRIVEEFKKMIETIHPISERDKNGVAIDDEIGRVAANMDSATAELANAVAQSENEAPAATVKKELVVWAEKDIDDLIETHFSWQRIPTTLQIRVAQEDFWIFKNLIDAIKSLNEGVENRSNASLKEIRSLLIAGDAIEKFQARQETGFFDEKSFTKTGAGIDGEMGDGAESGAESGADMSSGGEGGEALKKEFKELYNMRYVDSNGKGLTAEQYNASISYASAGIKASKTRNMPVYMSLVIKQNRLSDLMSSLTNAEKPLDIKLVLINPGQGWTPSFDFSRFEDASAEGDGGEGADGGSHGRTAMVKPRTRGGSRNNDHSHSSRDKLQLNSDEIIVDIYGIIRLFNAPSMEMFPDMAEESNANDNNNADNTNESGDEENASDAEKSEDTEQ